VPPKPQRATKRYPNYELEEMEELARQYRSQWKSRLPRRILWIVGLILALWVLASAARWAWIHPLF
jgi:hypothetical protein